MSHHCVNLQLASATAPTLGLTQGTAGCLGMAVTERCLCLQDQGGFYDRAKLFWKSIEDVTVMAGCGMPGGGRQDMSARFTRHLHTLSMPPTSEVCPAPACDASSVMPAEHCCATVQRDACCALLHHCADKHCLQWADN